MATTSQLPRTRNILTAKHVLFLALGIAFLFIVYRDEQFFIDHKSNTWKFFYPVRWKLFAHALGGVTVLVLGALQFSSRLRESRPALHRLLGRFYIGGVLIAAPMAVYLAFTHALPTMSIETTVQSSLWVLTTFMALLAARNRNFEVHRQWVMRSYAVTLIFVVSRIVLAIPGLAPVTDVGAERLLWILNICALAIPQLIINWHQLFARTAP